MRRYLILIVILVLLAAIGAMLELPRVGSGPSLKTVVRVEPAGAATVRISHGASDISLKKSPDGWRVFSGNKSYPADTARIAAVLSATSKVEGEVVSINPENHPIFGVDMLSGTVVTLSDRNDSTLASIIMGNPSKDFVSTYVRETSSEEVYAIPGLLLSYFRADPDFYRKREILSFQGADLETLKLAYPNDSIIFARDTAGQMTVSKPHAADHNATLLEQAVAALSRLNATGFDDNADEEKTGLRSPELKVSLVLRTGRSHTVRIGKTTDNNHYVLKDGDPTVYLVNRVVVERFFKTYEIYLNK